MLWQRRTREGGFSDDELTPQAAMSRGSKSKMQSSRSSLLSPQENEMVEELLGRRCAVSSELTHSRSQSLWDDTCPHQDISFCLSFFLFHESTENIWKKLSPVISCCYMNCHCSSLQTHLFNTLLLV